MKMVGVREAPVGQRAAAPAACIDPPPVHETPSENCECERDEEGEGSFDDGLRL